MTGVFISYKSDDLNRVAPLAQVLEQAGLSVWWDRRLAGGESWRGQIQEALTQAKCVVVVWTHNSVGPAGDFVRDEASEAKSRGLLVPVKLDAVKPPLGFGEVQAIDLTKWKGSTKDPFFQDLLAAVQAKIDGRAVPPAKGPMERLRRRITYSSVATLLAAALGAFGSDSFHTQEKICGGSIIQPQISDLCGALGFGARATKQERIAWEQRKPGSCADLRTHVTRFPGGAYSGAAMEILASRRVTETEVWANGERRLSLYQSQEGRATKVKTAAQTIAVENAISSAERLCKGFAAAGSFRFIASKVDPQKWNCAQTAHGYLCGFEGEAVCQLQERTLREEESCGK